MHISHQKASLDIYSLKYQLKNRNGELVDADINATFNRVAKALAKNEKKSKDWEIEFKWAMDNGAIPAGRILSNAGAGAHKPSTSLINCLGGNVRVLTDRGLIKIKDLVNLDSVNVIDGNGNWSEVSFECYGKQKLFDMKFKYASSRYPITVPSTTKHRWILNTGRVVTTEFYLSGSIPNKYKSIAHVLPKIQFDETSIDYKAGVAHGIVYGDGTLQAFNENGYRLSITLCKGKVSLSKWIIPFATNGSEGNVIPNVGVRYQLAGMPSNLKLIPSKNCSSDYILGFFSGILATDGIVVKNKAGSEIKITGNKELTDWLEIYLPAVGIKTTNNKLEFAKGQKTNLGIRTKDVHVISIAPQRFSKKLIINKKHIDNYQVPAGTYDKWMISDISNEGYIDKVYCCEEPNTGSFVIEGGLLTGNCVVSSTIKDSIDGIFTSLKEAAVTLATGAGIGYDCSTIRPNGAFVTGAGANTSGTLPFMDVFDKMCFTISSAGGRRGAQMLTCDCRHPDIEAFIKAKREDGRLRQFNMSVLITDEFMNAVKNDEMWHLIFPANSFEIEQSEDLIDAYWPDTSGNVYVESNGKTVCKVYKSVSAKSLFDLMMTSTYEYAEPGFMLIDKINKYNNNWFCEEIRATNPCVSKNMWTQTDNGPYQVKDLIGKQFTALVNGEEWKSDTEGFFKTGTKKVYKLMTKEGYSIELTKDHKLMRKNPNQTTEWIKAKDFIIGDKLLVNNHQQNNWDGRGTHDEGYLLGTLLGDGTISKEKGPILTIWLLSDNHNDPINDGPLEVMTKLFEITKQYNTRSDFKGWKKVKGRNEYRMNFAALTRLTESYGMSYGHKEITSMMENTSSDFYIGFLQGLFDTDGTVGTKHSSGIYVRLSQSDLSCLESVQRMLLRLGIKSNIYKNRRKAGQTLAPDGHGGKKLYNTKAQHELNISNNNIDKFQYVIDFNDTNKRFNLEDALNDRTQSPKLDDFTVRFESLEYLKTDDVYDVSIPGINSFDCEGLWVHNCGEQPLSPYAACLLGSINLTAFVDNPFTEEAVFDYERYIKVIHVFSRMLDNVVELNGLPLKQQRKELLDKRRHGMGFTGLGSTLVMLGMKYGSDASVEFSDEITRMLAIEGFKAGIDLSKEKGPAPIMNRDFEITNDLISKNKTLESAVKNKLNLNTKLGATIKGKELFAMSEYFNKPEFDELRKQFVIYGSRYTHATSIAPTGTISLSIANNASNGIEPSFSHHYIRNVIIEGKKTKQPIDVFSYELLSYKHNIDDNIDVNDLPVHFDDTMSLTPSDHLKVQAAVQKWIDSAISKTINVPTDIDFEDFKHIYQEGYELGLKGVTTFRFNPNFSAGVLSRKEDLENTEYSFELENGKKVTAKGSDMIEYNNDVTTAANLYEALKEGTYGKY